MKRAGGHHIADVSRLQLPKQLGGVHGDAVSLNGPDVSSSLVQRKALLGVGLDNVHYPVHGGFKVPYERVEQHIRELGVACLVQL